MEGFVDLMFAKSYARRLRGALRSAGIFARKEKI
jgi:hypothetical protein